MGVALRLGYDLGALAGCFVVIGLLSLIIIILSGISDVLNISIFGQRPLKFLGDAIQDTVISGLNDARTAVSKVADGFMHGLGDSLTLLIGIPLLLALGVKTALQYLWSHALVPLIHFFTNPVVELANQALAKAIDAAGASAHAVSEAAHYTDSIATKTFHEAAAYTATNILAAVRVVEEYADQAVSKLRAVEDASIAEAEKLAREGEKSVAAGATAAVATVEGAVIGLTGDVASLRKYLDSLGLAGLIATVPALLLLVNTLAKETGLENSACRSKVKQICGTNPAEWEALIAGIAAVAIGFNLKDIVEAASGIVSEAAPLIHDLAA